MDNIDLIVSQLEIGCPAPWFIEGETVASDHVTRLIQNLNPEFWPHLQKRSLTDRHVLFDIPGVF